MRRHRTTAILLLLAGLAAAVSVTPASGRESGTVPRLIFPLVAKTDLWDNYGDPRSNGRHAGIDMRIRGGRRSLRWEDGTIKYWESSGGCMIYLYGRVDDVLVHPPEQRPHRPQRQQRRCVNDVSFAVPNGAKVTAGQQIAWNGDSGDADGNPHLHFEVHPNDGADVVRSATSSER
jgi:hypothetical protein